MANRDDGPERTDAQNLREELEERKRRQAEAAEDEAGARRRRIGHIGAAAAGTVAGGVAVGAAGEFDLLGEISGDGEAAAAESDEDAQPDDGAPLLDVFEDLARGRADQAREVAADLMAQAGDTGTAGDVAEAVVSEGIPDTSAPPTPGAPPGVDAPAEPPAGTSRPPAIDRPGPPAAADEDDDPAISTEQDQALAGAPEPTGSSPAPPAATDDAGAPAPAAPSAAPPPPSFSSPGPGSSPAPAPPPRASAPDAANSPAPPPSASSGGPEASGPAGESTGAQEPDASSDSNPPSTGAPETSSPSVGDATPLPAAGPSTGPPSVAPEVPGASGPAEPAPPEGVDAAPPDSGPSTGPPSVAPEVPGDGSGSPDDLPPSASGTDASPEVSEPSAGPSADPPPASSPDPLPNDPDVPEQPAPGSESDSDAPPVGVGSSDDGEDIVLDEGPGSSSPPPPADPDVPDSSSSDSSDEDIDSSGSGSSDSDDDSSSSAPVSGESSLRYLGAGNSYPHPADAGAPIAYYDDYPLGPDGPEAVALYEGGAAITTYPNGQYYVVWHVDENLDPVDFEAGGGIDQYLAYRDMTDYSVMISGNEVDVLTESLDTARAFTIDDMDLEGYPGLADPAALGWEPVREEINEAGQLVRYYETADGEEIVHTVQRGDEMIANIVYPNGVMVEQLEYEDEPYIYLWDEAANDWQQVVWDDDYNGYLPAVWDPESGEYVSAPPEAQYTYDELLAQWEGQDLGFPDAVGHYGMSEYFESVDPQSLIDRYGEPEVIEGNGYYELVWNIDDEPAWELSQRLYNDGSGRMVVEYGDYVRATYLGGEMTEVEVYSNSLGGWAPTVYVEEWSMYYYATPDPYSGEMMLAAFDPATETFVPGVLNEAGDWTVPAAYNAETGQWEEAVYDLAVGDWVLPEDAIQPAYWDDGEWVPADGDGGYEDRNLEIQIHDYPDTDSFQEALGEPDAVSYGENYIQRVWDDAPFSATSEEGGYTFYSRYDDETDNGDDYPTVTQTIWEDGRIEWEIEGYLRIESYPGQEDIVSVWDGDSWEPGYYDDGAWVVGNGDGGGYDPDGSPLDTTYPAAEISEHPRVLDMIVNDGVVESVTIEYPDGSVHEFGPAGHYLILDDGERQLLEDGVNLVSANPESNVVELQYPGDLLVRLDSNGNMTFVEAEGLDGLVSYGYYPEYITVELEDGTTWLFDSETGEHYSVTDPNDPLGSMEPGGYLPFALYAVGPDGGSAAFISSSGVIYEYDADGNQHVLSMGDDVGTYLGYSTDYETDPDAYAPPADDQSELSGQEFGPDGGYPFPGDVAEVSYQYTRPADGDTADTEDDVDTFFSINNAEAHTVTFYDNGAVVVEYDSATHIYWYVDDNGYPIDFSELDEATASQIIEDVSNFEHPYNVGFSYHVSEYTLDGEGFYSGIPWDYAGLEIEIEGLDDWTDPALEYGLENATVVFDGSLVTHTWTLPDGTIVERLVSTESGAWRVQYGTPPDAYQIGISASEGVQVWHQGEERWIDGLWDAYNNVPMAAYDGEPTGADVPAIWDTASGAYVPAAWDAESGEWVEAVWDLSVDAYVPVDEAVQPAHYDYESESWVADDPNYVPPEDGLDLSGQVYGPDGGYPFPGDVANVYYVYTRPEESGEAGEIDTINLEPEAITFYDNGAVWVEYESGQSYIYWYVDSAGNPVDFSNLDEAAVNQWVEVLSEGEHLHYVGFAASLDASGNVAYTGLPWDHTGLAYEGLDDWTDPALEYGFEDAEMTFDGPLVTHTWTLPDGTVVERLISTESGAWRVAYGQPPDPDAYRVGDTDFQGLQVWSPFEDGWVQGVWDPYTDEPMATVYDEATGEYIPAIWDEASDQYIAADWDEDSEVWIPEAGLEGDYDGLPSYAENYLPTQDYIPDILEPTHPGTVLLRYPDGSLHEFGYDDDGGRYHYLIDEQAGQASAFEGGDPRLREVGPPPVFEFAETDYILQSDGTMRIATATPNQDHIIESIDAAEGIVVTQTDYTNGALREYDLDGDTTYVTYIYPDGTRSEREVSDDMQLLDTDEASGTATFRDGDGNIIRLDDSGYMTYLSLDDDTASRYMITNYELPDDPDYYMWDDQGGWESYEDPNVLDNLIDDAAPPDYPGYNAANYEDYAPQMLDSPHEGMIRLQFHDGTVHEFDYEGNHYLVQNAGTADEYAQVVEGGPDMYQDYGGMVEFRMPTANGYVSMHLDLNTGEVVTPTAIQSVEFDVENGIVRYAYNDRTDVYDLNGDETWWSYQPTGGEWIEPRLSPGRQLLDIDAGPPPRAIFQEPDGSIRALEADGDWTYVTVSGEFATNMSIANYDYEYGETLYWDAATGEWVDEDQFAGQSEEPLYFGEGEETYQNPLHSIWADGDVEDLDPGSVATALGWDAPQSAHLYPDGSIVAHYADGTYRVAWLEDADGNPIQDWEQVANGNAYVDYAVYVDGDEVAVEVVAGSEVPIEGEITTLFEINNASPESNNDEEPIYAGFDSSAYPDTDVQEVLEPADSDGFRARLADGEVYEWTADGYMYHIQIDGGGQEYATAMSGGPTFNGYVGGMPQFGGQYLVNQAGQLQLTGTTYGAIEEIDVENGQVVLESGIYDLRGSTTYLIDPGTGEATPSEAVQILSLGGNPAEAVLWVNVEGGNNMALSVAEDGTTTMLWASDGITTTAGWNPTYYESVEGAEPLYYVDGDWTAAEENVNDGSDAPEEGVPPDDPEQGGETEDGTEQEQQELIATIDTTPYLGPDGASYAHPFALYDASPIVDSADAAEALGWPDSGTAYLYPGGELVMYYGDGSTRIAWLENAETGAPVTSFEEVRTGQATIDYAVQTDADGQVASTLVQAGSSVAIEALEVEELDFVEPEAVAEEMPEEGAEEEFEALDFFDEEPKQDAAAEDAPEVVEAVAEDSEVVSETLNAADEIQLEAEAVPEVVIEVMTDADELPSTFEDTEDDMFLDDEDDGMP